MGTPCGARTGIVRAPHGNRQCFSYPTEPVRGPCGTRKGAARQPYGHLRELTQPELAKLPCGRRIWPYGARKGPLRAPQELFTGCLQTLNPYGARKLIMHALKLYGPRTGRQNSYGAARGPRGPREWTYDFCSKQPGNSPYVMWCDWGITKVPHYWPLMRGNPVVIVSNEDIGVDDLTDRVYFTKIIVNIQPNLDSHAMVSSNE